MNEPSIPDNDDQLSLDNPVNRHPRISPPKQDQPEPAADHGEESYIGTGRLKGRKALVTGGDSGIGAAVAIAFAREGADVAIAYLPAEEADARKIIAVIDAEGRVGIGLAGDLLDADYRDTLVDRAAEMLGGLDILVNNAGKQIAVEHLEDLDDEQVMQSFQVNILAMFTLTRAALKHFPDGATVINTTSVQAYDPSPTLLDYASTKAAINAFTKGLAVQLAPRGIRVPGSGPFFEFVRQGQRHADRGEGIVQQQSAALGQERRPAQVVAGAPEVVLAVDEDEVHRSPPGRPQSLAALGDRLDPGGQAVAREVGLEDRSGARATEPAARDEGVDGHHGHVLAGQGEGEGGAPLVRADLDHEGTRRQRAHLVVQPAGLVAGQPAAHRVDGAEDPGEA